MRFLMAGVSRIEQSDKNVYIEQRNTHSPSRSRFTSAMLGFAVLLFGTNSGTPFLTREVAEGSMALRNMSETICPIVVPRLPASSLAMRMRSSSRSIVVLTVSF